jgi:hypothetical protein
MEVKGTWITDYVRMIRANKDKDWDKYLKPEDWKIIKGKVLSSVWYPYDSFIRMGLAVFFELAQGELAVTRAFGKMFAENITQIYRHIVLEGDPSGTIAKIYALQGTFFRDIPSMIVPVAHEKNRSVVRIGVSLQEEQRGVEPFAYQFLGMLERLLEKAGAKKYQGEARKVEGGYELELHWE